VEPRVTFITIACADVAASRRFYVDGLGWAPLFELPDEVVFVQVGHGLLLALWRADALAEDIGAGPLGSGPPAVSLAHNVATEQEVLDVMAAAERAGATILKPAQMAFYGGLQGYFADPDGVRWEVAHNPGFAVAADGTVTLAAPPA
jgi:catechol 2,3-dioxygenase-like lactoylglutathione lyase family enzyme